MSRPVIGITTWRRPIATDLGAGRPAHTLGVEYADPVERAGGAVVLLPPTSDVEAVLDRLDGLVISGGQDVDPSRYGSDPQSGQGYDPDRDAFELALAREARRRRIPVLAICRGLQVVNVAFGGTLVVDIPRTTEHPATLTPQETLAARHRVQLAPGSALSETYDATDRVVNTIHHQAVDRVAPGLRVVAHAPDGIVEAIEADDDWPLWAVQWHPEKLLAPAERDDERALFDAFVAASRARSRDGRGCADAVTHTDPSKGQE